MVTWPETVLVDEPLGPYLERLRTSSGADIGVHGSIGLAQGMLAADLVDRLELVVVPTVAGSGRRLFTDNAVQRRLDLASVTRTSSGCLCLSYRRKPE